MSIFMTLRTALTSLGGNKLRAALTLLGVVIGVASVITLMAIGKGAQAQVTERIQGLGTNLLFVRPGNHTQPRGDDAHDVAERASLGTGSQ